MNRIIHTLDRTLTPVLILGYTALCIVLLAVTDGNKGSLLLAILCAAIAMTGLHWGTRGILTLANRHARTGELKLLTRIFEGLLILLTAGALVAAILLWEVPSVWLFFPVPLFGLQGAVRFDASRF